MSMHVLPEKPRLALPNVSISVVVKFDVNKHLIKCVGINEWIKTIMIANLDPTLLCSQTAKLLAVLN